MVEENNQARIRLGEDGMEVLRDDGSWARFSEQADGGVNVEDSQGRKVAIGGEGPATISLPAVTSVGVKNILDIQSHTINRDGDRLTHRIVFNDGRQLDLVLRFTSPTTAEMETFSVKGGGDIAASADGEVMIGGPFIKPDVG